VASTNCLAACRYLDKAVAVVLAFIGGKMVADQLGYHASTTASLEVVAACLATGTVASLLLPKPKEAG
jgi:predicted tellurium resistance membrane protein TerC